MAKKIRDVIESFDNGTSLIDEERKRQCLKGFGRDHDDGHTDGSIMRVALDIICGVAADEDVPDPPEWVPTLIDHIREKYRHAPIRKLVIAGAMIVAEIERRERIELKKRKRSR